MIPTLTLRFRRLLWTIGTLLLVSLALMQCFSICSPMRGRATQTDFSTYYLTAQSIAANRNPYTVDFGPAIKKWGYDTGGVSHATDPPTLVMMIAPLAWLSIDSSFRLWSTMNVACLALSIFLIFGPRSGLPICTRWILISALAYYPPIESALFFSQGKIQILMLLSLMPSLLEKEREGAAGLVLALAILLRIFPLLIVGYVILFRRWRLLGFVSAGCAIGTLLTLLVLGLHRVVSFTHGVDTLTDLRWASFPQDFAVDELISRVLWTFSPLGGTALGDFLRAAIVASAKLGFMWLTVRTTLSFLPNQDSDWRLFSLWVVTSVLLSPIAWLHYEVMFLNLFSQLGIAASHGRASWRAIIMAIANWRFTLIWARWGDQYPILAKAWWQQIVAEFGSLSMIAAYISAYWFAVDDPQSLAATNRDMPTEG